MAPPFGYKRPITPEYIVLKERIEELWSKGYSASIVADNLGVTRNVVIGHVSRMGLQRAGIPSEHQKTRGWWSQTPRPPKRKYTRKEDKEPVVVTRGSVSSLVMPSRIKPFNRNAPEPSKEALRREIEQAFRNTAVLPKPILTSEGS